MNFKTLLTGAGLVAASFGAAQANLAFQQNWRSPASPELDRTLVSPRMTGGAFVATSLSTAASRTMWIAAYGDGGTRLWNIEATGWSVGGLETAPNGDALLLLRSATQALVRRYSAEGALRWSSAPVVNVGDAKLKPLRDGRVALLARSADASTVYALDANLGTALWNARSRVDWFTQVGTDEAGRLYVSHWTPRTATQGSFGVRRFALNGAPAGEYLDPVLGNEAAPGQMFVAPDGNVLFAGVFSAGLRYFRLNPEMHWASGSTTPVAVPTSLNHLVMNSKGVVYASGFRQTADGGRETMWAGTLAGTGLELRGSAPAGGPASNLVLMPGNDLYSANYGLGSAPGSAEPKPAFLRRWSAAGQWISDTPLGMGNPAKPVGLARHLGGDLYTHLLRVETAWTTRVARYAPTPMAAQDSYAMPATGALIVDSPAKGVLANDTYGVGAIAVLASPALHGSVTLNPNGTFTYAPEAGFMGEDSFTYRAQRVGVSAPATVVVRVSQRVVAIEGDALISTGRNYAMSVRMGSAAQAPLSVALSYSGAVTGPASVSVSMGSSQGAFQVTACPVSVASTATITATYQSSCVAKSVMVKPLSIASFTPTAIMECNAQGRWELKLDSPVSDGCPVTFESGNPSVLPTPAPGNVARGSSSTLGAFSTRYTNVEISVPLTVRVNGLTRVASVTVRALRVRELVLGASSVSAGSTTSLKVRLSAPAPEGGLNVTLRSNSTAVSVPAEVRIAAGQSFVEVPVQTRAVPRAIPVTLTANANGLPLSVTLTVNP